MNENGVDLIIGAMDMLPGNDERIQYLLNVCRGTKFTESAKAKLADRIVEEFYDKVNTYMFCKELNEAIGGLSEYFHINSHGLRPVLLAIAIRLEADMASDKSHNSTMSSFIYDQVEFLYLAVNYMVTSETNRGVANKLARRFGQVSDGDFIAAKFLELFQTEGTDKEFLTALAEGAIKSIDPILVLRFYLQATRGKQASHPEQGSIDGAKSKFRKALHAFDSDNYNSVNECKKLFAELVDMCDGDPAIALKVVEENRPDLLGEFTPDYSENVIGGRRAE